MNLSMGGVDYRRPAFVCFGEGPQKGIGSTPNPCYRFWLNSLAPRSVAVFGTRLFSRALLRSFAPTRRWPFRFLISLCNLADLLSRC